MQNIKCWYFNFNGNLTYGLMPLFDNELGFIDYNIYRIDQTIKTSSYFLQCVGGVVDMCKMCCI